MNIEILEVTPEMAKEYLKNNSSNRKINKKHLSMIVRSIKNGEWRLNHQGIAFYSDGEIADGQHRLNAIIEAGKSIKMPVFTGIEKTTTTSLSIDCGRSRTVVDGAKISGDNLSSKDVVVAKGLEFGYKSAFPKLSHMESYRLCEKRRDELIKVNMLFPKHKPMISIAPVKVACIKSLSVGVRFGVVESFVNTLLTGEYTNPVMVNAVKVRNKLMTQNFNGGGDRELAFNMVINTLIRSNLGELIVKINTLPPRALSTKGI